MKRRTFLGASAGLAAVMAGGALVSPVSRTRAAPGTFEIQRSDDEWRALLTPEQYAVLREEATERAFTSPLNDEKRPGRFHCAGCDLPVYSSEAKFDSGTGWPSFWQSLPDAVGTREDRSFFMLRTECHCRRCGGHLGHVFDDGPPPTGMRHCINGVALAFRPAGGERSAS